MSNLGEAYVEIRADTSRFERELKQTLNEQVQAAGTAGAAVGQAFSAGLASAQKSLADIGKKATETGRKLSMSLTLPIVGLGVAAFKTAADFEKSMASIVGLVGVAQEQIDAWEEDVKRLAVTYGSTAGQAADALYFITSAGVQGQEAMQVLEQSLKATAIGLGDLSIIADLATSALNAYGSNVISATDATDVMVATVREGKLEADALAGSMGRVLPIASSLGVSFNEVGAAFAALSRTGTNAAEAATQIRGILATLVKPTKEGSDQLKLMGMSFEGLRQQIKDEGLLVTLKTLTSAFGDNEEAQAKVFGNIRALSGIMDLFGANVATTEQIFKKMETTTGDTDKAFAAFAETTGFQTKQAFAEMKLALLEFGDALAPTLQKVGTALREMATRFQGFSEETKKTIIVVAGLAAVLGPTLLLIGGLAKGFSAAFAVLSFGTAVVQALTGATVANSAATRVAAALTKAWTVAQTAFNAVMALNPIALAVIAIAALVAAIVIAYKKSETFREVVQAAFDGIKTAVAVTVDFLVAAFQMWWERAQIVFNAIKAIAEPIIKGIAIAFQASWQVVQRVFGLYRDVAVSVFRAISAVVRVVAGFIGDQIGRALRVIGPIVEWLRDKFGGAFSAIYNIVKATFTSIPQTIAAVINAVIGGVEKGINGAIKGLNVLIRAANNIPFVDIAEVAEVSFGRVTLGAEAAGKSMDYLSRGIGDATRANVDNMKAAKATVDANSGLTAVLNGTGNAAAGAADDMGDFSVATAGAGKAAKGAKEEVKSFGAQVKEGLAAALEEAKGALEQAQQDFNDFAKSVSDSILQAFDFGAALENGEEAGGGFIAGLERSANKVIEYAAKVQQLLDAGLSQEALQKVLASGMEAGSKIADQLLAGGEEAIGRTNRLVEAARLAADKVGVNAAGKYLQAGVTFAQNVVNGLQAELDRLTPALMAKMDAIAASMKRTVSIEVRVTEIVTRVVSGAAAAPRMAEGGIVPSRPGGSLAVIGEAGAEAVIPITRPARALDLMEQSGLAALVRAQGQPGSAVSIGTAVFQQPSDADLVAQKVMAAWRTRSAA